MVEFWCTIYYLVFVYPMFIPMYFKQIKTGEKNQPF